MNRRHGFIHVGGIRKTHDLSCDTWLYAGRHMNILIDPGNKEGLQELRNRLGHLGLRLGDIQVVYGLHEHLDHVGAMPDILEEAPDIRFFAGEDGIPAIQSGDYYETCGFFYGQEWGGVQAVEPLTDGMRFDAGDATFTAYAAPGHSPGSMALETICAQGRFLHTSDTLFGDHFDETMADLSVRRETLQSLRKIIMKRRIQYLTIGHADPQNSLLTNPMNAIDAAIEELETTYKPWRKYYTSDDMKAGYVTDPNP